MRRFGSGSPDITADVERTSSHVGGGRSRDVGAAVRDESRMKTRGSELANTCRSAVTAANEVTFH